jgi:hypothetical protein
VRTTVLFRARFRLFALERDDGLSPSSSSLVFGIVIVGLLFGSSSGSSSSVSSRGSSSSGCVATIALHVSLIGSAVALMREIRPGSAG